MSLVPLLSKVAKKRIIVTIGYLDQVTFHININLGSVVIILLTNVYRIKSIYKGFVNSQPTGLILVDFQIALGR